MKVNFRIISLIGILTFFAFLTGNFILFVKNPNLIKEIESISILYYNINGLNGQDWAAYFNYLVVGALSVTFFTLLIRIYGLDSHVKRSIALLIISGLLYSALSLVKYDPGSDGVTLVIIVALLSAIFSGTGLIYLGFHIGKIFNSKIIKTLTLAAGFFVLLTNILGFIFLSESAVLIDLSWAAYFFWHSIIGISCYRQLGSKSNDHLAISQHE